MVEGPGCKLKGEKVKSKLLKQCVTAVKGNAVDREEKCRKKKKKRCEAADDGSVPMETSFHRMIGQPLDEVLTLGKELFMFFGDACLRVHFLMAGSFHVDGQQADKDGGRKIPATASLEIQFSKDLLTFYKCAVEIRPSMACRQKHFNLKDLDICSPTFNHKRAVMEMMLEQERQLCDVLLDQDILPGVGNIIKNEALFDSGLKPDSKIKDLSEEHISHLVKMTRDFSMVFYKCRKSGTNLRLYMKVYQRSKCGECETKIIMTRMGEDSERVTYFCPTCQTNDITKRGKLKLPSKNSLLKWVQTFQDESEREEWSCSKCTLLNPANRSNCCACLNARNSQPMAAAHGQPTQPIGTPELASATQTKRKLHTELPNAVKNECKKLKTEVGKSLSPQTRFRQGKQTGGNDHDSGTSQGDQFSKIPACRGHGIQCAMRQTFKDNENKGRWFFSCAAAPARKRCNYFQWADERFPTCLGHGKPCSLRTVMKQGPSNGRRFFCCPLRKNTCQFFEWAVGYG